MTTSSPAIRVGILIPENNTRVEQELPLWLPGSQFNVLRISRGKGLLTAAVLPEYKEKALVLATQFAQSAVDVVAYGCTAAGFLLGPDGDRELAKKLQENSGKPVETIASAMTAALKAKKLRKIAVVSPYSDSVNAQLKNFLSSADIGVAAFGSLYAPNVQALGRIDSNAVLSLARSTMNDDCDAMFIACAQLPTFDVLHTLQREFGRPVLSSIQALASRIALLSGSK